MCAGMPRNCAARATAAPWLPDECVATPRSRGFIIKRKNGIGCAARLKRTDFLKIFALKEQ